MQVWDYCAICGRGIPVGEMCYGLKKATVLLDGESICKDCIQVENTGEKEGECAE